jgi:muskelin
LNFFRFIQRNKHIYIFGGQRCKEKFSDFLKVDVDTKTIMTVTTSSVDSDLSPPSPFSHFGNALSTFDEKRGEIFVISPEYVWVFATSTSEWTMICKNPSNMWSINEYAALDSSTGNHIIVKEGRMYVLELRKPSRGNIISLCKYLIRKQKYEEIAIINPIEALTFLQNNLAETINQSDNEQVEDFHRLASLLFTNDNNSSSENDRDKFRHQRTCLFNRLTEYISEAKCQPRRNLCNFINI